MTKHNWKLLNTNKDVYKKLIYTCSKCQAEYIRKYTDEFNEISNCQYSTNDIKYFMNSSFIGSSFDLKNFSGVYITNNCIDYIENGVLHRKDGPAKIILNNDGMTENLYFIDNEYINNVNSIEEAIIKKLIE